jgi:hypothetical protein
VTGTYTDRQGAEKKRYANVGTLFQYEDGGFALKLDSIPVGDGWNGFVSFFDLETKGDTKTTASAGRQAADMDDEIPF